MTLSNSYAALDEFLALPEMESAQPGDDVFIERLLERCSREFDGDTGNWFYAHQQARNYDMPRGRCLELDAPLLSVTSITNGDDTTIESTEYLLYPLNGPNKAEIRIKQSSAVIWQMSGADTEGVITVRGEWGYVDRDSTDPETLDRVIVALRDRLHPGEEDQDGEDKDCDDDDIKAEDHRRSSEGIGPPSAGPGAYRRFGSIGAN